MQVCREVLPGKVRRKMEKKRLLIATDTFPPRVDGVSRFVTAIVPELKNEFDITILAPKFGKEMPVLPEFEGVEIIGFPVHKKMLGDFNLAAPKISTIWKKVRESDIIFSQSIAPIGIYSIACARLLRKKIVIFTHVIEWQVALKNVGFRGIMGSVTKFIIILLSRIIYGMCNLIITPSNEISEIFSNRGIRTLKKVIPLGIDRKKFIPPKDRRLAKMGLGINPENIVVGYCGRLSKEKDLKTLNRAFRKVRKKNRNINLLVVGDGLEEIRRMFVGRTGVHFLGIVSNTVPYYQAMDIFVMPSL
ncbi:MAG: glycosyltransferase, partial [Candidatus Woesearchaeota archaeon]|nr:glycosyltransferase [Candidatus Woesearchaeota archaeon]